MSPRTRQLLLLFGIVALVALSGCADDLGGPDSDIEEEGDGLEETPESDDDAANDTGDENDANESDGETANETDDGEADDDSPVVISDSDDDESDDGVDDDGSESDDDGAESDDDDDDGEPAEPDQSLLTLTVVDEDGEPIEGVDVYGLGEEHEADIPLVFEGETDEDGQYTDVIYENEYTVDLDHEAYNATTFEHTHDGELEVTVTLESDGEETGELEFEVLETTWGGGAEGVVIEGEREEPDEDGEPVTFTTETDESGMASVDAPYGTYDVTLDGEDYEPVEGQVEHRDHSDDELEPVPELFEINLIPPEYDVTVTVVDEDGEPIDGVDIEGTSEPYYADQNDSFEVTGVNGSTTITTLGEGVLTLNVTPTETDHESETVEMSLRQDEEITVELESSDDD